VTQSIHDTMDSIFSVQFTGQRVSAERAEHSPTGWCATGWDQGLPVVRKPITAAALRDLMDRLPHTVRRFDATV